jgi:hypothetical protein
VVKISELETIIEKLSQANEHQRLQISEYVERVGSSKIEHASLTLKISSLEGNEVLMILYHSFSLIHLR